MTATFVEKSGGGSLPQSRVILADTTAVHDSCILYTQKRPNAINSQSISITPLLGPLMN